MITKMAKNVKEGLVQVESRKRGLFVDLIKYKYLDDVKIAENNHFIEQIYAVILPTERFFIKANSFQDVANYLEEKFHVDEKDSMPLIVLIGENHYELIADEIYTGDHGLIALYYDDFVSKLEKLLDETKENYT